jgi:hypothetical protein
VSYNYTQETGYLDLSGGSKTRMAILNNWELNKLNMFHSGAFKEHLHLYSRTINAHQ